jgi:choline-phosphate cytidylyltransferase
MDVFFTEAERENVANWERAVDDRTISTRLLRPVWNVLLNYIPETVSPNVLSLSAMLMLIEAWYIVSVHMDSSPHAAMCLTIVLFAAFYTLDALDGLHAKKIMNDSPIGELFDQMCSNVGVVFMVLALCEIFEIDSYGSRWNLVQASQLLLLRKHITAFKSGVLTYRLLAGPGELLFSIICVIAVRAVLGLSWFLNIWRAVLPYAAPLVTRVDLDFSDPGAVVLATSALIYYFIIAATLFECATLSKHHFSTRNGIFIALCWRTIPAILMEIPPSTWTDSNLLSIVGDGLIIAMVNTDVAAAKMAKRELHPLMVIFTLACPLNALAPMVVAPLYWSAIFFSLSKHMNMPLFAVNRNVYVDGVYDLCHLGHMNLFRVASGFGTRLIVGVCGDEDCAIYKRPPIMSTAERVRTVAACKCVSKVVPNAPTFGLTAAFLKKHRIHVVAHSAEYDKPEDKYYKVPREMGMTKVLPRTEGVSTSELIRRVVKANAEGTVGSPKLKLFAKTPERKKGKEGSKKKD